MTQIVVSLESDPAMVVQLPGTAVQSRSTRGRTALAFLSSLSVGRMGVLIRALQDRELVRVELREVDEQPPHSPRIVTLYRDCRVRALRLQINSRGVPRLRFDLRGHQVSAAGEVAVEPRRLPNLLTPNVETALGAEGRQVGVLLDGDILLAAGPDRLRARASLTVLLHDPRQAIPPVLDLAWQAVRVGSDVRFCLSLLGCAARPGRHTRMSALTETPIRALRLVRAAAIECQEAAVL